MGCCNYFHDLEIGLDASGNDVREAYKRLAKLWHPDKNKATEAEEKFKQILAAYNYLQSDDRRETHAREIKRQNEVPAPKVPKPPPQPASQSKSQSTPPTSHSKAPDPTHRSSKPKQDKTTGASKNTQRNWWESFKSKQSNSSKSSKDSTSRPASSTSTTNHSRKSRQRPGMHTFFNFMSFDDPFDDMLFDIFMIPPERPPPKAKPKTDPFGNKLPKNIDGGIYDWKAATKPVGKQPDYQDYLDNDTEFSCHYCGMMMNMEILRKHERKCQRLGGKRIPSEYQFDDEEVNEAYTAASRPASSTSGRKTNPSTRKIKCQWCGGSFVKDVAAAHMLQCRAQTSTSYTPRYSRPSRPEWDNNFAEAEYDDVEPIFSQRPRSARINIDSFTGGGARSTCLQCRIKYGLSASELCTHS